jgi:hypothetical protein
MFSYQIYTCCSKCQFPDFSLCELADYPGWLCGSEAYDCVFSCRDEDSVLEAVVEAGSLGITRRKRDLNITDSEVRRTHFIQQGALLIQKIENFNLSTV